MSTLPCSSRAGLALFFTLLVACGTPPDDLPSGPSSGSLGGSVSYFGPDLEDGSAVDTDAPENPWLTLGSGGSGAGSSPGSGSATGAGTGGGKAQAKGDKSNTGPVERAITAQLLLTEYEETSRADKALVVSHMGGESALAGDCAIAVYSNGNPTPSRSLALGPVASGDSVTLCTAAFAGRSCAGLITGAPFNGNDALVVRCGERVTDSFGQVGVDPGSAWTNGTVSSKDQRLLRCSQQADTDPTDAFQIASTWVRWPADATREGALALCAGAPGEGGQAGR